MHGLSLSTRSRPNMMSKQVYFSPTAYNDAFEEFIDMTRYFNTLLPCGGMRFVTIDDHLILDTITKETSCAKIRNWCTCLKGAWLISVDDTPVCSVAAVNSALDKCHSYGAHWCIMLFLHPDVCHGLTNKGIPQVTLDQLNPRLLFKSFELPKLPMCRNNCIQQVWDGNILLHYVTKAQHLTQGCLIFQDDWDK